MITEDHKVVVFSQWETMIHEAAKVLDPLGVGYAVLHGGLPGKDRKAVLERFQTDPACRVFLSTDAGGTGLNLQAADTVVNLELPWNPAVLEQRIARVHRMGQSRPVRVVNLVTRGTIEERVLRTLEAKRGLFAGVFEGDADEIPFEAFKTSGFLDSMRALVNETQDRPEQSRDWGVDRGDDGRKIGDGKGTESIPSERAGVANPMWHGIAQLLEAACATLSDPTMAAQVPPEHRKKLQSAARKIAEQLASDQGGD